LTLWDEVEHRRLKYFEQKLGRLASEVGGFQGYQAERVAQLSEDIEELQKELKVVTERVDRMAEFLNVLKAERKNGENHD